MWYNNSIGAFFIRGATKVANAKKLKEKLTVKHYEELINSLGIRFYSKSDNQWVLYNADKYKKEADQKPKLYFYLDSKIFMSFSKGCSYDIFGLIQTVKTVKGESFGFTDALNYVLKITNIDPSACERLTKKSKYNWEEDLGKYLRFRKTGSSLVTYDAQILDDLSHSYPQDWINEGISIESMEKYGIGYYERTNAITIPCRDKNGNLIGIRVRNQRPELVEKAKYIPLTLLDGTCYKFNTNSALYGLNYNWAEIERSKQVILVESEKSVLKADTFFGEKSNVLALYGSNLGTERRNELIKLGVEEVVIGLDSDYREIGDDEYMAFEKKVEKFAKAFQGYCKVSVCYNNIGLDGYKCSPFDFDKNTFDKLFINRENIY